MLHVISEQENMNCRIIFPMEAYSPVVYKQRTSVSIVTHLAGGLGFVLLKVKFLVFDVFPNDCDSRPVSYVTG